MWQGHKKPINLRIKSVKMRDFVDQYTTTIERQVDELLKNADRELIKIETLPTSTVSSNKVRVWYWE